LPDTEDLTEEERQEWAAFMADLAAEPDAGAHLRAQLHQEAIDFLALCITCARRIDRMEDVWKARSLILDVTVWARELKTRLVKETAVIAKAKNTAGAFKR
jgi:hypothetical protein